MIMVTVKYLASFSAAAGKTKEEILLPESATVTTLIETLKKRHGKEFSALLARDEAYRNALFLRCGIAIEKTAPLSHGDEIIISLPIGGG